MLTANDSTEWIVNSHITCQSKFVIYFLKCLSCNEKETYSGQTNHIRNRTNNHISDCRTGRTTDKFDLHVHKCNKTLTEPFFKLYVFVELSDGSLLDAYEDYIHRSNFDTMNRQKKWQSYWMIPCNRSRFYQRISRYVKHFYLICFATVVWYHLQNKLGTLL